MLAEPKESFWFVGLFLMIEGELRMFIDRSISGERKTSEMQERKEVKNGTRL